MKNTKFIFALSFVLLLTGCSSFIHKIWTCPECPKPPQVTDIRTDSAILISSEVGLQPYTGSLPLIIKQIRFNTLNEQIKIPFNTPFKILVDSMDFYRFDFKTEIDSIDKTILITTINKEVNFDTSEKKYIPIIINRKCFQQNFGLDTFPSLYISPELSWDKVIIIPRFNNCKDCEQIGWQIRYGEIRGGIIKGCENEEDKDSINNVYSCYEKCYKNKVHSPPPPPIKKDCLKRKLFGVPCP